MNYKETSGVGSSWVRAYELTVYNPYDSDIKSVEFYEERVVNLGDTVVFNKIGSAGKSITNAQLLDTFPILDVQTGEATGTMTYLQLYQALHSLYIATALERDQRQAEQEAVEEARRQQALEEQQQEP
jgi:hypothetical protein